MKAVELLYEKINYYYLENGKRPKAIVTRAINWLEAFDHITYIKHKAEADFTQGFTTDVDSFEFTGVKIYCIDDKGILLNLGQACNYVTRQQIKKNKKQNLYHEYTFPLTGLKVAIANHALSTIQL
jgi:hypothetical protein